MLYYNWRDPTPWKDKLTQATPYGSLAQAQEVAAEVDGRVMADTIEDNKWVVVRDDG